jgi:hypothetical protein
MSVNALAFIFGAFLVLTAILGGGFEIKELKVPKVGWAPRFLATIAGLAFIMLGVGMTVEHGAQSASARPPAARPAVQREPQLADVQIVDQLDQDAGQVSEHVDVIIDGKVVGTLGVDPAHTDAMMGVSLKPGLHSYALQSDTMWDPQDGSDYVPVSGDGQGQIDVEPGKIFDVTANLRDYTLGLTLVEREQTTA